MRGLVSKIGVVLVVLAGSVFVASPPAAAADAIVYGGAVWLRNDETVSPDGRTGFAFALNGKFVVWHDTRDNVVWNSGRRPGVRGTFQTDGNLVIYNKRGRAVWNTGTWQNPCSLFRNCTLHVQDDGNVVLYDPANFFMWHTDTYRR
jgi:hypothetical protein